MSGQNTVGGNATRDRGTLLRQLKSLQVKAEEVASGIRAVDATFQDMGFRFPTNLDLSKPVVNPGTGIRNANKAGTDRELLSYRGQLKAQELFRFIDRDRDQLLNYEDFRSIKSFSSPYTVVQDTHLRTWESWRLYMRDSNLSTVVKATEHGNNEDKAEAVRPTREGVSQENFVRYCRQVELEQPISDVLENLGLGFLPQPQQHWLRCKILCEEIVKLREDRRPPQISGTVGTESDEMFTFEDVSFVVNNMNFGFTKLEVAYFMLHRARNHRLQVEMLRTVFARRMLSQQDFPFELDGVDERKIALDLSKEQQGRGDVSIEEFTIVERKYLLPWLLACPYEEITKSRSIIHLPKTTGVPSWQPIIYRSLIIARNYFVRFVRHVERASRMMYHFAGHMNDRLIFRDFVPFYKLSNSNTNSANQKALLDVSTWKLGLSVGDEENRDGGLSGSLKLTKIENVGPVFKNLKVPVDAGACLSIDLLFTSESSTAQQEQCADLMKRFLAFHVEKELRSNRLCNGVKCMATTNENDESRVLRIVLSYKRLVSLDSWLEHMLIPYRIVPDLLSVLVIDMRSNLEFTELLSSRMTTLNDSFSASIDLTVGVRRNLIVALLERAWIALQAGITKTQTSNDLGGAASIREGEEHFMRRWRWQQLLPHFPRMLKYIRFMVRCLKCMKTSITRFKFTSLGEFLQKINIFSKACNCADHHWQADQNYNNIHMTPSLRQIFTAGWLKDLYEGFIQQFSNEFNHIYFALKDYLEERKRKDDIRRKEDLINSQASEARKRHDQPSDAAETGESQAQKQRTEQRERDITLERLKRLGVDTSSNEGKDLFDAEPEKPAEFNSSIQEESTKQDIQNLILLEHMRMHLIGLHSMELILGRMKISVNVQGLDIFELLPELPSMLRVQQMTMLKSGRVAGST